MKFLSNYFAIASSLILLNSCSKENNNIKKLTGVWDVIEYEQNWYENDAIDSTIIFKDTLGWIGFYNHGDRWLNKISPSSTFLPYSWVIEGVAQFPSINWESDRGSGKTIAFYYFGDLENHFARYTVKKNVTGNKMSWTYYKKSGVGIEVSYSEVIKLKRRK